MEWGMPMQIAPVAPHRQGEVLDLYAAPSFPLAVDTHGRRFHVEWDADAPVTPLGQLVFFSLKSAVNLCVMGSFGP